MAQIAPDEDIPVESPPFCVELLDHARRCWDAERENAERLRNKHRLLLAVLAALFGLGLFRVEWLRGADTLSRISPWWMVYVIKGLLTAALLIFAVAFQSWRFTSFSPSGWLAPWSRRKRKRKRQAAHPDIETGAKGIDSGVTKSGKKPPFASQYLHFPDESDDVFGMTSDEICKRIYYRARLATENLRKRNIATKENLGRAQVWLLVGVAFIGAAMLCYLWSSCPPM